MDKMFYSFLLTVIVFYHVKGDDQCQIHDLQALMIRFRELKTSTNYSLSAMDKHMKEIGEIINNWNKSVEDSATATFDSMQSLWREINSMKDKLAMNLGTEKALVDLKKENEHLTKEAQETKETITLLKNEIVEINKKLQAIDRYKHVHCGPDWVQVHNSCIKFVKDSFKGFDEARRDCQSMGADLFVVSNTKEFNSLKPALKNEITSMDLLNWFIGLQYVGNDTDGQWFWVNNEPYIPGFPKWAPAEPNDEMNNRCAVLEYLHSLKDQDCSTPRPYICKLSTPLYP